LDYNTKINSSGGGAPPLGIIASYPNDNINSHSVTDKEAVKWT